MQNTMMSKLRAGQPILGLTNMYPASGIIEGMCKGWDFVWIDGQHGEMSYDSCLHAAQAARGLDLCTMIRVPGHDHRDLGTFADLAPSAIMVPMVNTVAEAKHIVAGLRFPPLGVRSYGGRRVIDLYGREYYREADLGVIAQIETLEAVDNAAEIAAVEGIDALFFGPDDMKMRMGLPINTQVTESPELRAALERTAKAALAAGKQAASVGASSESVEMLLGLGYRMFIGGGDIAFLRTAAAAKLDDLRAAVGKMSENSDDGGSSGVY